MYCQAGICAVIVTKPRAYCFIGRDETHRGGLVSTSALTFDFLAIQMRGETRVTVLPASLINVAEATGALSLDMGAEVVEATPYSDEGKTRVSAWLPSLINVAKATNAPLDMTAVVEATPYSLRHLCIVSRSERTCTGDGPASLSALRAIRSRIGKRFH